ncbi:hypothetical protein SKAU_G00113120 [Synaphobranchus kaupii]|uniref:Uncharacterized protein n=1 Tax=Synaphobranchus kaupii TaxID=118154 RepID=A0A9Q1J899_SYNKA|nr:hypothetical protein SKAU_G00113120 [Synaphobranchus kaupii]
MKKVGFPSVSRVHPLRDYAAPPAAARTPFPADRNPPPSRTGTGPGSFSPAPVRSDPHGPRSVLLNGRACVSRNAQTRPVLGGERREEGRSHYRGVQREASRGNQGQTGDFLSGALQSAGRA